MLHLDSLELTVKWRGGMVRRTIGSPWDSALVQGCSCSGRRNAVLEHSNRCSMLLRMRAPHLLAAQAADGLAPQETPRPCVQRPILRENRCICPLMLICWMVSMPLPAAGLSKSFEINLTADTDLAAAARQRPRAPGSSLPRCLLPTARPLQRQQDDALSAEDAAMSHVPMYVQLVVHCTLRDSKQATHL